MSSFWRDPLWPPEIVLHGGDLSASRWILPRLLPWGSGQGTRVGSIVPTGFPAYARVLHPARRSEPDPVTTWRQVEVTWREVAHWSGRRYHPLMQFGALSAPNSGTHVPAPFDEEPWEGHLFPEQCHRLFSALAAWTATPGTCWARYLGRLGIFRLPQLDVVHGIEPSRDDADERRADRHRPAGQGCPSF